MKNYTLSAVVIFFIIFFICSCSGKPERSRKPVCTIQLMPAAKNYILGQQLTLKINTKLKNGELKKVDVFHNNKHITTDNNMEFTTALTSLNETGVNTIRIYAEKTDGISTTRIQNFTVLSDIIPEKYNYTIVREFHHSIHNFTQGIQLHNGILYEGTGEYGKSALYKVDYLKGAVLKSKKMDDHYFGEGITILNNKVYQLTYKNQVGFIYNVSDFAVVDSFRFDSKEGWGLTNDGTSLIMSDGTGTLTWIDPADFSNVKKIQVADHQKIFQFINELEYENGHIWANVWGSDQIIKIDTGSGKVMGIIDLKGILSIMTMNQTQRIDVLNGIAVIPESGNLLVTGKLWPKMFEIKIVSSK